MKTQPVVVTLCGSTRFRDLFARAFYREEHAGRICLTVPCYKDDSCCKTPGDHARLDELHLAKIDLSTEIFVIDPERPWCPKCERHCSATGGCRCEDCGTAIEWHPYIGESTRREIAYAEAAGKKVRYLSQEPTP